MTGQHLAGLTTPPQELIVQWIEARLKLDSDPFMAESSITGRLVAAESAPGKALFQVTTFGGIDAQAAGIPASHLLSWSADASDSVMLGGTLYWMPSRYVGGVALEAAKEAMPGITSMAEALGAVVGCADLAASLSGGATCDAACLEELCVEALGDLWKNGLDASADAGIIGEIDLAASCPAKVDDYAAPMAFSGPWLGTMWSGSLSVSLNGMATGTPTAMDDAGPGEPMKEP